MLTFKQKKRTRLISYFVRLRIFLKSYAHASVHHTVMMLHFKSTATHESYMICCTLNDHCVQNVYIVNIGTYLFNFGYIVSHLKSVFVRKTFSIVRSIYLSEMNLNYKKYAKSKTFLLRSKLKCLWHGYNRHPTNLVRKMSSESRNSYLYIGR